MTSLLVKQLNLQLERVRRHDEQGVPALVDAFPNCSNDLPPDQFLSGPHMLHCRSSYYERPPSRNLRRGGKDTLTIVEDSMLTAQQSCCPNGQPSGVKKRWSIGMASLHLPVALAK